MRAASSKAPSPPSATRNKCPEPICTRLRPGSRSPGTFSQPKSPRPGPDHRRNAPPDDPGKWRPRGDCRRVRHGIGCRDRGGAWKELTSRPHKRGEGQDAFGVQSLNLPSSVTPCALRDCRLIVCVAPIRPRPVAVVLGLPMRPVSVSHSATAVSARHPHGRLPPRRAGARPVAVPLIQPCPVDWIWPPRSTGRTSSTPP